MKDINKVVDSVLSSDNDENIDSLVRMIKNGEAGVSSSQVKSFAQRLMPMLDEKQRRTLRKILSKADFLTKLKQPLKRHFALRQTLLSR